MHLFLYIKKYIFDLILFNFQNQKGYFSGDEITWNIRYIYILFYNASNILQGICGIFLCRNRLFLTQYTEKQEIYFQHFG